MISPAGNRVCTPTRRNSRTKAAARGREAVDAASHRPQPRPGDRLRADRHRAGLRVRLLGHPGLPRAARRGPAGQPGQLQPGDHHDRPGVRRPHLRRADHRGVRREGHRPTGRARQQDRRAAGHPRRADRAEHRRRALRERGARELRRRADRRRLRGHPARRGPAAVQGHRRQGRRRIRPLPGLFHHGRGPRDRRGTRTAGRGAAVVHHGRPGLGHGLLRRGRRPDGRRRARRIAQRPTC